MPCLADWHRCCPGSSPPGPGRTCPRPRPRRCSPGSAAELICDLERIYQRKGEAERELHVLLAATGTTLTDLHGIGPYGAARLLAEVGEVTRFPSKADFASWDGTAPIDASSGDQIRHRLSRGGNRQINRVLHIMAVVQLRNPAEGRAYYNRKLAAGKTPREAMLRPRTPTVWHPLSPDEHRRPGKRNGPGRTPAGRLLAPARPACTPAPALRTSHFPDPPPTTLRRERQPILLAAPGTLRRRRTADVVKRTLLDDGEDRGTLSRPGMPPLKQRGARSGSDM